MTTLITGAGLVGTAYALVAAQRGERTLQRARPPDDHEVMPGLGLFRNDLAGGIAQPSPDPIADHRVAHLAADRETDTRHLDFAAGPVPGGSRPGLEDQAGSHPFAPRSGDAKEIRASFQAQDGGAHGGFRRTGAYVPWRVDWPGPGDRPRSPCGRGSRGGACG